MKILSKTHSTYPRVGNSSGQQQLRRAYNQFDRGKISQNELEQIINDTINTIIGEQLQSGCDFVTDGMIRYYDPISHLANRIKGCEVSGLLRFFDTNTYYRQPEFKALPEYDKPLVLPEIKFLQKSAEDKASASLFGPYSFLKLSITGDLDFGTCLNGLAEIYAREIADLHKLGIELIQFEEPAITKYPGDIELMQAAYGKMLANVKPDDIMVALYFGDASKLVGELEKLPVGGICFDFTYSRNLPSVLRGFSKRIGLGIIDGRNTRLENPDELARHAEDIIKSASTDTFYITTSCGLEYLPRNRAYDKLILCATAAKLIKGNK